MRTGLERNAKIRVTRDTGARVHGGAGAHGEGGLVGLWQLLSVSQNRLLCFCTE